MKIAVFGANGRVGSCIVDVAQRRGHQVCSVDKQNCTTFDTVCDVAIDFSTACATQIVVDYCTRHKVPLVVGTTGQSEEQLALLDSLSSIVTVVKKANFSKGIELMKQACLAVRQQVDWDVAMMETHRKGKLDCPSGTAKELASVLDCKDVSSIRLANQLGTHTVVFGGENECIEITHRATSVNVFALGAVEIAEKIAKAS